MNLLALGQASEELPYRLCENEDFRCWILIPIVIAEPRVSSLEEPRPVGASNRDHDHVRELSLLLSHGRDRLMT